ncbi:hypothetical protein EDB81DRAFT_818950, partial [Dactylonectria macrodidyma]
IPVNFPLLDAYWLHSLRPRHQLFKLPRIAEIFSRRLQIQERLTEDVAYATMETLKPQSVAVTNDTTLTSCVLGCFERKIKARNEFLHCIFVGVNR